VDNRWAHPKQAGASLSHAQTTGFFASPLPDYRPVTGIDGALSVCDIGEAHPLTLIHLVLVCFTLIWFVPVVLSWVGDARFARRASREMDGWIFFIPGVGLAGSANPGLEGATALRSSFCCALSGVRTIWFCRHGWRKAGFNSVLKVTWPNDSPEKESGLRYRLFVLSFISPFLPSFTALYNMRVNWAENKIFSCPLVKMASIASMQKLPHTHSCFVCGESNPIGLNLRFEADGGIVRTRFTPRAEHIGFKQVIHGGLIATVLDEIMVWACVTQTKRFAYCAELTVRFQNPLRPGEETFATAELVANRRNRIFEVKSELKDSVGKVFATATGKYIPVKSTDLGDMATDVVGNLDNLLEG